MLYLVFEFEEECEKLIIFCEKIGDEDLQPLEHKFPEISTIISNLNNDVLHLEDMKELFTLPHGEKDPSEVQKLNHEFEKILEEREKRLREEKEQEVKKIVNIFFCQQVNILLRV